MKKDFKLQVTNDITLLGVIYEPDGESKGVVQICHGMAEHIGRYDEFMQFLCNNGYVVVAYDQRGHGKTAGSVEKLGYMSDNDNFQALVDDLYKVNQYVHENYPNKLIYLFGHSMGSFVSQRFIELHSSSIDGCILSGSSFNNGLTFKLGHILASIITKFKDRKYISRMMDNLSFQSYNKKFKPNITTVDWLSRDMDNNRRYVEDPYCGTIFTVSFFKDLTGGFKTISKNIELVNNELPIYIMSGDCDPVGNFGKGTTKLYKKLKNSGIKDLTLKLYKDGRHEMLNEINKDEVYNNILEWINNH